jgi:hypothetical protein
MTMSFYLLSIQYMKPLARCNLHHIGARNGFCALFWCDRENDGALSPCLSLMAQWLALDFGYGTVAANTFSV